MNIQEAKAVLACMVLASMLIFSVPSYAEIDTENVVAVWLFDEDGGDVIKDSSGNGHDGQAVGGPAWEDGQFGKALQFDGVDDWVEVDELGVFDEVTICVWARYTGKVGIFRVIFNNNGWAAGDLHHQIRGPNELVFGVNGDGGHLFSEIFFDDSGLDIWHHFASSYSSANGFRQYHINGEPDASSEGTYPPVKIGPGRIGSWDTPGREWPGLLDELVIFNTILEQDDIQEIMNNGIEGILSVDPAGKLATRWGNIKAQE